jgi:lexA DNA binding domain
VQTLFWLKIRKNNQNKRLFEGKQSMKKKEDKDGGILAFLQERKHASVEEICEKVYASPSTVRRRLTELQRKGLITRTHGGAQINDGNSFLPSFTFRSHQNSLEKKKIALSAIKLIKNGDVIFLDGSTSAFFIAEYLSEFENIKVLTNGIDTLSLLSRNGVTAYSTGGLISGENRSVLIGRVAAETIGGMYADVAFFSALSVGRDGAISDCFEDENALRLSMMKNAAKKVFLCDSTKFGKRSAFRLCSVEDVDCIVTDRDIRNYFEPRLSLPEILF